MNKSKGILLRCYIPFLLLALFLGAGTYITKPVVVDGSSMSPTYENGEVLGTNRYPSLDECSVGDVVVVTRFEYREEKINVIKRIVGMPGDTLIVRDGYLYRNGMKLDDGYPLIEDPGILAEELTVGDGYIFVMGDNRNHSWDSRFGGCVKAEDILGIVKNRVLKA